MNQKVVFLIKLDYIICRSSMTEGIVVMDEDELRVGKKRRSTNPAIALAEEAVRMQHEVVAELRKKAASRIGKDEAAKKATTDKQQILSGEQKNAETGSAAKPSSERTVPRAATTSTLDIEA